MANEAEVVVLADQDGNYYVLSRQLIESARVADQHKAEVEAMLNSDTHGYSGQIMRRSSQFLMRGMLSMQMDMVGRVGAIRPAWIRMITDAGQMKI